MRRRRARLPGRLCICSGIGMGWGTAGNPGADQDPAELGEHVLEGELGLGGIPELGGAATGDARRVVAVAGVPDDDQGMHEQGERDGPPRRRGGPGCGPRRRRGCCGHQRRPARCPAEPRTARPGRRRGRSRSVVTRASVAAVSRARMTRTVRTSRQPYHRQVTSARSLGLVAAVDRAPWPLSRTRTRPSQPSAQPGPCAVGRLGLQTRGGESWCSTAFLCSRVFQVTSARQVPQRRAVIVLVRDHVHRSAGEHGGQQL